MWIVVTTIIFAFLVYLALVRTFNTDQLKSAQRWYRSQLRGEDVLAAYEAGKKYYAALRGGEITQSDLLLIAQDLDAMVGRMDTLEGCASFLDIARNWKALA